MQNLSEQAAISKKQSMLPLEGVRETKEWKDSKGQKAQEEEEEECLTG